MVDPVEVNGSSAVSIDFAERFLVAFDPEYPSEDMPYQSQAHVRFQDALNNALKDAGFAIVPVVATSAMIAAGEDQCGYFPPDDTHEIYRAMIAAAKGE